ncbi:putative DD41D transposase [Trichonephila inaurata madagascariensis]|uniref:Putative DD41D transposase n=1 Tax=Trichonephila inaurata madagascariensis TaxID=2747483 RepID=A0A8X7BXM5_9ARAC|nr:putative DD41D transposase [Trichonephila inaurata madagascariensis]
MVKYTNEQRLQILKIYYRNSESVAATLRALTTIFGRNSRPSRQAVTSLVKKFESTYSLCDVAMPVRLRVDRSVENITTVETSVANDPNQSIPRRSQELGIAKTTLWRNLRKDLTLHPYKIRLTQELKPMDHSKGRTFSDWALEKMRQDDQFHRKIIFSDEAHFWLNGFVNKQNMRYWAGENPHVLNEKPLHPQKITVWCGLHAGGIIGPYFFVDDSGRHVTVNGDRYRAMIIDYFWPELEYMDLDSMWFQQDGATSHTAHVTIDLLKNKFDERVISRNGPVNRPPRSCDLTPLDFFLWGCVKSLVYANKPTTLEELKANIEREIAAVSAEMCGRVMENWVYRINRCKRARGGHMSKVEFHS